MAGGITAGMAGAQGAMSYFAADSANKAITANLARIKRAGEQEQAQLVAGSGLERLKRVRAFQRVEGRLRTALAGSGDATGEALARQNVSDAETDRRIIQANLATGIRSIRSGVEAESARLRSEYESPLLAGFSGATGGAAQGVQIASATGPQGLKWWGG